MPIIYLHIIDTHNQDSDKGDCNAGVVLPTQFFFQEKSAPKNRGHAVGGNNWSRKSGFSGGKGIDVSKLAGSLKTGSNVLGNFQLHGQGLLLNENSVDESSCASYQKRQFIGNISGILVQSFENKIICKCTCSIQQTVGNRKCQSQPGFGIFIIRCLLACGTKRLIFVRFNESKSNDS